MDDSHTRTQLPSTQQFHKDEARSNLPENTSYLDPEMNYTDNKSSSTRSSNSSTLTKPAEVNGPLAQKIDKNPKRGTCTEPISYQIRRSKQKSASNQLEFLPIGDLHRIVNDSSIRHLLRPCCRDMTEQDLASISFQILNDDDGRTGRRQIFALLALLNKPQYISDFINDKIRDCQLPFKFHWAQTKYEVFRPNHKSPIALFDKWSENECEMFRDNQRSMLAPVFKTVKHEIVPQEFGRNTILPFLEYSKSGAGAYGKVFKVKIHPSHHTFNRSQNLNKKDQYFAVKALRLEKGVQFEQEVEALKKISTTTTPHPHLIRLLGAYKQDDHYGLLFPWADCNLLEYWEKNYSPSQTVENARWFIGQCKGIASGLRKIHKLRTFSWYPDDEFCSSDDYDDKTRGRHGDLKPENILCFESQGEARLVITDFGFSRYHTRHSKSNVPFEELPGWTGAYRPPECDMKTVISQRYDMWTLGCVFLIFSSWYIFGYEKGVHEFAMHRAEDDVNYNKYPEDKFFNKPSDKEAHVKESVINWIAKIRGEKRCPAFMDDFLSLIESLLLCPESRKRADCQLLCRVLGDIQQEVNHNEEYCLKGLSNMARKDLFDDTNTKQEQKIAVLDWAQIAQTQHDSCDPPLSPKPSEEVLEATISLLKPGNIGFKPNTTLLSGEVKASFRCGPESKDNTHSDTHDNRESPSTSNTSPSIHQGMNSRKPRRTAERPDFNSLRPGLLVEEGTYSTYSGTRDMESSYVTNIAHYLTKESGGIESNISKVSQLSKESSSPQTSAKDGPTHPQTQIKFEAESKEHEEKTHHPSKEYKSCQYPLKTTRNKIEDELRGEKANVRPDSAQRSSFSESPDSCYQTDHTFETIEDGNSSIKRSQNNVEKRSQRISSLSHRRSGSAAESSIFQRSRDKVKQWVRVICCME